MEGEIKQRQAIPWGQIKELGFFRALTRTIGQVLFKPDEFFANVDTAGHLGRPFLFYFIVYTSSTIISSAISLKLDSLINKKLLPPLSATLSYFLLIPVLAAIFLYLWAGLAHLFVMLFRGQGKFRGTFCVFAYNSACAVWTVIPFAGPIIGGIWAIVNAITGFKQVHKFKTLKAALAYFSLPALFVIIAICLSIIFMPKFLKAQMAANEDAAQVNLKNISFAIENYNSANGAYPAREYELLYAKPAYLDRRYDNELIMGYKYSLNLDAGGYQVSAKASGCGSTGTKDFSIDTSGLLKQEDCKKE